MKSSFDILTIVYSALNVAAITDLIDGSIYKSFIPAKSQKQDIEINVLSNVNEYLQRGFINVNFYCPQTMEGTPDNKKLNELNNALFAFFDDTQINGINFQVDSQSGAIKDNEPGRDGMYFSNLKIKFNTL